MDQQRLFRLAPEAMFVTANYVPGEGWRLTASMRRQDEPWSSAYRVTYSHLTSPELSDVILSEFGEGLAIF
jgi:hypothetical protein